MVHTEGEFAVDGRHLWILGDCIWCTKCGGYANRVPRKPRTLCTTKIEGCGARALRWLRAGRSPLKPHGLIAPFGTQPSQAWNAKPPGADSTVDVGDSDDDAAEQRAIVAGFIGSLLARIDAAAAPGGAGPVDSDTDRAADDYAAQTWPGLDDRTAWAVSARAHWRGFTRRGRGAHSRVAPTAKQRFC